MGICNIKGFFNSSYTEDLGMAIADAYYDAEDAAKLDRRKLTTADFYNRLVSVLKSEDTPFQVEYSSELTEAQKKLFKQSFAELKQAILDIIPNEFKNGGIKMSELQVMLNENLQSDLNAGRLKIDSSEEESFAIESEGATDLDTPVKEVKLSRFLDDTYGNCFGAVKQMKNMFSREIFTHTMCDFENGFFVTTNEDLNRSIALYKNNLLGRITQFLSSINPSSSYSSEVYTEEGNVHRRYYDALSDMEGYLRSIDTDQVINDEYSKKLFGGESPLLDAVHAYTMLKYFDSLLQETLGKTIKYNSRYKNTEVRLDLSKYQFSRDSEHHRKSWNDAENRTAVQNSSRFSKFVLESIPLKVNGKDTGKNVGINQLSMTITKLFSNISYLSTSKARGIDELVGYVHAFHGSPTLFAYKIFDLINSSPEVQSELRRTIGFTEDDLGVIQSLYEYVFSYDSDMHLKRNYKDFNAKSIRSMEYNRLKTSYNLGKYSILSDIVGVIDDCMDATYFYAEYGLDGGLTVQKRVKYKDRRGSEKFKDTLNAANTTYSRPYREELQGKCRVDFTIPTSTQNATVTIPIKIDGQEDILSFKVSSTGILGILEQSENITISAAEDGKDILRRVYDIFGEDSTIDLGVAGQRARLLADDADLSTDEQLFKQVLQFIDDRLLTQFLSVDGLQKLNFFKTLQLDSGNANYINDLLLYAVKSQIVSDIYLEFDNKRLDENDPTVKSKKDFEKFLKRRYQAFANITDEQRKTYFITNNGISKLRTIPSSTQWVDSYAQATLILQGETAASVSKNQSGNNDANYVTAFLGGQIFNVCYKARQAAIALGKQNAPILEDIANTVNASLETDPVYQSFQTKEEADAYAKAKYEQAVEEAGLPPMPAASALLFTNHMGAIKQCVINSDVKNRQGKIKNLRDLKSAELYYNAIIHNFWSSFIATGEYCIQPTTYSDKVKLIQYLVDGKDYKGFGRKSLSQLTKEETIELYRTSIGRASRLALDNVVDTFSRLWGEKLTIDLINERLKSYTEEKLTQEAFAKGIPVMLDFHYRVRKIDGKESLMVNEILRHEARYEDAEVLKKKFAAEEINFINNLVDSGVFFYIDYHDTSLYDKDFKKLSLREQLYKSASPVANILLSQYKTDAELSEYFAKWVKNGKLVLAYDQNGEQVLFKNVTGVSEINPLLEKFFYVDSLVSNNLRLQLTGFETNHPDKSKFSKMWDNVAKGVGITNELASSSKNIGRLQKAKVIWGHPALGKTTYLTANPDRIIEWDNEFNPMRNEFIAKALGTTVEALDPAAKQQFLYEVSNYMRGVGEYNEAMSIVYEEYKDMLMSKWEEVKNKAASQKKKLFASPSVLLDLFADDFDLILTMDQDTFLSRKTTDSLGWKQDMDVILSRPEFAKKTINVGNLYMSEIMAMNDAFDLHALSNSQKPELQELADRLMTIVENISQSTQLKRNVIIPATMHYMHNDLIEGVAKRIKVAIIKDIPAKVFNFSGDSDAIDSMDGSAYTTSFQSILENKTLGSQEVGADKKPIWHHYDQASGTAGLMKFASFEINNERMLLSLNSDVPLIRMFKKMTNLQWANLDENGVPVDWNTQVPVTLGRSTKLTGINRTQLKLDFMNDIMQGKALYYRTYDPQTGETLYKQIVGFGGDATNGYYTIESYVDEYGDPDLLRVQNEQVYHYFNANSEHHTTGEAGDHTINSLYELWQAMGGMYSQELGKDGIMDASEASNYAVVEFMNKTLYPKSGANDRYDISQNSYYQPLKEMQIGYLTNNSAMKNGATYRNSANRWFDEGDLTYMEMDSDGLGIQMDADHDVEEAATMTEFSQVISSLESGGYLHKYAKQVYQDLGKVAAVASLLEINAVTKFLAGQDLDYDAVKNDLYDIIGRTLLNGVKTREDLASLTDNILKAIEKRFNRNIDHLQDVFKVPFSDSNVYSQILPTVASIINKKSIKRKYPGSGCVMIPGFNVIQYFNINGNRYTFNDLVRAAIADAQANGKALPPQGTFFERTLVQEYLNAQLQNPELIRETVNDFIPTDIVDVMVGDQVVKTIKLDDLTNYYKFKDQDWAFFGINALPTSFRYNVTQGRNLAPVRITWKRADNGQMMNIFDLQPFRDSYENPNSLNREAVQQAFRDLQKGYFIENGQRIGITDLKSSAAELVISNMYSTKFGTGNKSIAQIRLEGIDAFRVEYQAPRESKHYDLSFTKINGNNVYISFESPKGSVENSYVPYEQSKLLPEKDAHGNIDVYLISDDNRKLFKVGRYILKEGYSYRDGNFYDEKDQIIPSKKATNLKADKSDVYEYIEFVSRYNVTERFNEGDDVYHIDSFDKYYINIYNIKKAFAGTDNTDADKKKFRRFVTNILNDIYSTELFLGIQVNPELSRSSAGNIVQYVIGMDDIDSDFRELVLSPMNNELRKQLKTDAETISIEQPLAEQYQKFYDKLAQSRYSSWEQSLYFTAARIPAQTLQSFMQMEAVAYSGNSRNIVYVSHWQAWLQGSDY